MDNAHFQLLLNYYLEVLQRYWSIIDLIIITFIVFQLKKLKKKTTVIEEVVLKKDKE